MITAEVYSYPPNDFGLYNMAGNVNEWVNDWYGPYSSGAQTNPAGPMTGRYRGVRGGDWSIFTYWLRAATRAYDPPDSQGSYLGFRAARSP
jgi:formylglycine-generating enzyme required for sulfatase activity